MNDVDGIFFFRVFFFGIKDENHLQPSPAVSTPDNPPFTLFTQLRIRLLGVFDDPFRLFRRDAVFADVFGVPLVPSKDHGNPPIGILLYMKIVR